MLDCSCCLWDYALINSNQDVIVPCYNFSMYKYSFFNPPLLCMTWGIIKPPNDPETLLPLEYFIAALECHYLDEAALLGWSLLHLWPTCDFI